MFCCGSIFSNHSVSFGSIRTKAPLIALHYLAKSSPVHCTQAAQFTIGINRQQNSMHTHPFGGIRKTTSGHNRKSIFQHDIW